MQSLAKHECSPLRFVDAKRRGSPFLSQYQARQETTRPAPRPAGRRRRSARRNAARLAERAPSPLTHAPRPSTGDAARHLPDQPSPPHARSLITPPTPAVNARRAGLHRGPRASPGCRAPGPSGRPARAHPGPGRASGVHQTTEARASRRGGTRGRRRGGGRWGGPAARVARAAVAPLTEPRIGNSTSR